MVKTIDDVAISSNDLLLAKALQQIVDLKALLDERDRRYAQQFTAQEDAVTAALTAQKALTDAAFAASEKAILKSDTNAEKWRESANEWRAAMMDREARFASRSEMEAKFISVADSLAFLKDAVGAGKARGEGRHAMWGYVAAGFGFLLTLGSLALLAVKFAAK